jgi:hypothetical protein
MCRPKYYKGILISRLPITNGGALSITMFISKWSNACHMLEVV